MKKALIIVSVIAITVFMAIKCSGINIVKEPTVHEGDVIFHVSTSRQSPLIMRATSSVLTHCGIIVEKDNKFFVLEASSTLKLTPLKDFIKRGKYGLYWIRHPKGIDGECPKIKYNHLLGRKYDLAFSPKNKLYYCSELVYDIYKYQLGIELCEMKPMKEWNLDGMESEIKRRGMNVNDSVVAPSDLYWSSELR